MDESMNPFADPEVARLMKERKVVHKPGMAADLMEQLRPFLLEDGYDLDNLEDTNFEEFQEAFARAVNRYNASIDSAAPVHPLPGGGDWVDEDWVDDWDEPDSDPALDFITVFGQAATDGNERKVRALVRRLQKGDAPDLPPVGEVLDVSAKLADFWLTSPLYSDALSGLRLPKWAKKPRAAGVELVKLGRSGEAFISLPGLVEKFGLNPAVEGALLAVATLLERVDAAREELEEPDPFGFTSNWDFAEPEGEGIGYSDTGGEPGEQNLLPHFRAWARLTVQSASSGEYDPAVATVERLLDPDAPVPSPAYQPQALLLFAEMVTEQYAEDPELLSVTLDGIDMYLHFRMETSADPGMWEFVHDEISQMMERLDNPFSAVVDNLRSRDEPTEEQQRADMAKTRIVEAVGPVLDWIGAGRRVTERGAVARKDVEEFAAFLGLQVIGAPKTVPEAERAPNTQYVRSMRDVPALDAWWDALQGVALIDVGATKAHLGPAAEMWREDPLPPVVFGQVFVTTFVHSLLEGQAWYYPGAEPLQLISLYLLENLENPTPPPLSEYSVADARMSPLLAHKRARAMLGELAYYGIVRSSRGSFTIPAGLRVALVIALQQAGMP